MISKYLAFAVLLVLQGLFQSKAWGAPFLSRNRRRNRALSSSSSAVEVETTSTSTSTAISTVSATAPTWEELTTQLNNLQNKGNDDNENENDNDNDTNGGEGDTKKELPLVTLYRDTNAWCPFCERVWFALQIKNIPYQETLVSLFNKPQWFVQMAPTALVPVVLIHTDTIQEQKRQDEALSEEEYETNEGTKPNPQRVLIWESVDILKALDEYFPNTPKLMHEDDEDFMKGREVMSDLTNAGFAYIYNMKNSTLTSEEKEMQAKNFQEKLDALDQFIGLKPDSPFFLNEISGLDVESIPTLERWRYQLPMTKGIDIMDGRPHLTKWFNAMDQYEPFVKRVSGDRYSWTAVASTFLRIFGVGKDGLSKEAEEVLAKVDEEAENVRSLFALNPMDTGLYAEKLLIDGRIEAAAKLISNHEAIVKDCTNADPKSQKDLGRAKHVDSADWIIRDVTAKLLGVTSSSDSDDNKVDVNEKDAATAARVVASRLCVPRDVGAPAAAMLRYELASAASELEG